MNKKDIEKILNLQKEIIRGELAQYQEMDSEDIKCLDNFIKKLNI